MYRPPDALSGCPELQRDPEVTCESDARRRQEFVPARRFTRSGRSKTSIVSASTIVAAVGFAGHPADPCCAAQTPAPAALRDQTTQHRRHAHGAVDRNAGSDSQVMPSPVACKWAARPSVPAGKANVSGVVAPASPPEPVRLHCTVARRVVRRTLPQETVTAPCAVANVRYRS